MKKTALVTGVTGGIGRAIARAFVDAGWEVVGIDRQEMDEPGGIDFIKGDLSLPASAEEAFKRAGERAGVIDALINNAAIQVRKPLVEMDVGEWDAVMASNLRSAYLAVRHCYRFMRRPGGAIVNVSSVHAVATSKNIAAYAASKGGLLALTRALSLDLAADGIRVNAVLPGAVDTAMLREGLRRGDPDEGLRLLIERTPLGRIGRPEEIAQAVLFLADNKRSSFVTGHALVVDGGALARLSTE